jgi:hypothetical protein
MLMLLSHFLYGLWGCVAKVSPLNIFSFFIPAPPGQVLGTFSEQHKALGLPHINYYYYNHHHHHSLHHHHHHHHPRYIRHCLIILKSLSSLSSPSSYFSSPSPSESI